MPSPALQPAPGVLHLEAIEADADAITLVVRASRPTVDCPACGERATKVHSRYQRALADTPWGGVAVRLRLRTRRWFCHNLACPRRIFTERLAEVAAPYARRTARLTRLVVALALELGGEAGARGLAAIGVSLRGATLLNALRATAGEAPAQSAEPAVLGVDDWAVRRGQVYGTILVDLERHRVVDLLPGRDSETLAAWLRAHPQVTVICRDRQGAYAAGARLGAPQAIQVADRWHLLHNLVEALEEALLHHRTALRQAAEAPPASRADAEPREGAEQAQPTTQERYQGRRRCSRAREERLEAASRRRHERVVEQYEAIRRLHAAGADTADIARTVGVSRRTVYRDRDLAEPPAPKQPRPRAQVLDPYAPYLLRRWAEGCHNGMRLYREIAAQGFAHGPSNVSRFVAQLHRDLAAGRPLGRPQRRVRVPTARQVAALFLRRPDDLTAEQRAYLQRLHTLDPVLAATYRLTQGFATLVRERQGELLDGWLAEANAAEGSTLQRFAASLAEDLHAVRAGVTERWSNGPTEGFVHKLKLVKRQGYGRAGFTLLRRRLLDVA